MMRLSVSNLAWPAASAETAFDLLSSLGVSGVEVAPTRIATWDQLDGAALDQYRNTLSHAGLEVSSLQALFFERPHVQLLGSESDFEDLQTHFRRVTSIAERLGASVLVFGAPRNRVRGELSEDDSKTLGRERFARLGEIAEQSNVIIAIEPVPAAYGCDFLKSWKDVLEMVILVDSPAVRVHLDTGCIELNGDSVESAVRDANSYLAHFHASQPGLGGFEFPLSSHSIAAEALRRSGYKRWVAIEMREQESNPLVHIQTAVEAVRSIYGTQID